MACNSVVELITHDAMQQKIYCLCLKIFSITASFLDTKNCITFAPIFGEKVKVNMEKMCL